MDRTSWRSTSCDFLIIGAGVIGLCIARELKKRYGDASIAIIEKESEVALHASGRNSGVLHAGFYYTKASLKAKFTQEGNQALTEYCLANNLFINRCGKLVVARNAKELEGLQELLKRGQENGIALQMITAQEAQAIEPRVKTFERALFSPTTSSVDPKEVMAQLLKDAQLEGIQVIFNTAYLKKKNHHVLTTQGVFSAKHIVNAAGLYADKIAQDFGFSKDYRILPFKGVYLYGNREVEKLNTHIYPVPDLNNPFLGVHFTRTVNGQVKIGPTAIPAFWREHYQGFSRFSWREMIEILGRELGLLIFADFDFRGLAVQEFKKYCRSILVKQARALVEGTTLKHYARWGKAGIRAQLLNIKKRRLEMDFVLEGDDLSTHVLNAVSPAFTGSMPFARYVVDRMKAQ